MIILPCQSSNTSQIKRIFSHEGIKYHVEDFDEPLEYKPRVKEALHEFRPTGLKLFDLIPSLECILGFLESLLWKLERDSKFMRYQLRWQSMQVGLTTQEFLDAERERLGPLYPMYFECDFYNMEIMYDSMK